MLDIVAIGDVTEDVFLQLDSPITIRCKHKKQECLLCMPFGTKIAVSRVDKLLGGNAGNVAIGASRLGLKSALCAGVGDDEQGRLILRSLRENNVRTTYFSLRKNEKTNYSVVLNYNGERTILVHHEKRKYVLPQLEKTKWIYLTSLGMGSETLFPKLQKYLVQNKAFLAFNPGTHQLNLGLEKLRPLLEKTEVIFLNVEEANFLLKTSRRDLRFLLSELRKIGPKIAVITDGEEGVYCLDGNEFLYCPIYKVPVVERTGAGDAFATGFVCALLYGKKVGEALRWGSINAAGVVQRIGPQEGLVRLPLLQTILNENPLFKPRLFDKNEVTKSNIYLPKKYKRF